MSNKPKICKTSWLWRQSARDAVRRDRAKPVPSDIGSFYTLRGGKVLPAETRADLIYRRRVIEQTLLKPCNVMVSTVFLGLDLGWGGRPLVFETMVFMDWGKLENAPFRRGTLLSTCGTELEMLRYSTLAEAKAGHRELVDKYRALLKQPGRKAAEHVRRRVLALCGLTTWAIMGESPEAATAAPKVPETTSASL